jgi:hypothetical protein
MHSIRNAAARRRLRSNGNYVGRPTGEMFSFFERLAFRRETTCGDAPLRNFY